MTSKYFIRLSLLAYCALSLTLLGMTNTSSAAEPLAYKPVTESNEAQEQTNETKAVMTCQSDDVKRLACRDFISGFLKGALLTDAAIIESLRPESKGSSLKDRALRTRVGSRFDVPTELAGFCLPADRSFDSIVDETLLHVASSSADPIVLGNAVYASLKKDYRCD